MATFGLESPKTTWTQASERRYKVELKDDIQDIETGSLVKTKLDLSFYSIPYRLDGIELPEKGRLRLNSGTILIFLGFHSKVGTLNSYKVYSTENNKVCYLNVYYHSHLCEFFEKV